MLWLTEANKLGRHACLVGCICWYLFAVNKNKQPFPFSNTRAHRFGLDRNQKYRSLKKLAAAGLIEIDVRGKGRSPVVTILELPALLAP
jgi:hypothetical protein